MYLQEGHSKERERQKLWGRNVLVMCHEQHGGIWLKQ